MLKMLAMDRCNSHKQKLFRILRTYESRAGARGQGLEKCCPTPFSFLSSDPELLGRYHAGLSQERVRGRGGGGGTWLGRGKGNNIDLEVRTPTSSSTVAPQGWGWGLPVGRRPSAPSGASFAHHREVHGVLGAQLFQG